MGYVWIYDGWMDFWHLFGISLASLWHLFGISLASFCHVFGPKDCRTEGAFLGVCWEELVATGLHKTYSIADGFQVRIVYSIVDVEALLDDGPEGGTTARRCRLPGDTSSSWRHK